MRNFKINVYITEGCRLTQKSSIRLVNNAEKIFQSNGFPLTITICSTTYVEKAMDNGESIYNFNTNVDESNNEIVDLNPHIISVENHKDMNLFPESDIFNLILVKSLHDTGVDSWPHSLTFKETNTIFISETCFESSLAHGLMNHFGVVNQYHDPKCLSYGSDFLRTGTNMSEDEKLIISEELNKSVILA